MLISGVEFLSALFKGLIRKKIRSLGRNLFCNSKSIIFTSPRFINGALMQKISPIGYIQLLYIMERFIARTQLFDFLWRRRSRKIAPLKTNVTLIDEHNL